MAATAKAETFFIRESLIECTAKQKPLFIGESQIECTAKAETFFVGESRIECTAQAETFFIGESRIKWKPCMLKKLACRSATGSSLRAQDGTIFAISLTA